MRIARSVAEVLTDHVVLEYEAIDRMYLNVYVPHLQTVGGMLGYLRVHRGQRFASTTAVAPMTEAFVGNIEQFVAREGIDLIAFEKGQRKDDVTQAYLRKFKNNEGVLYVGKAQEKARVYLKRQLAKRGVAFEALDNGIKSCRNPKLLQRLADELSAEKIDRLLRKWLRRLPIRFRHAIVPPAIVISCRSCRRSSRSRRSSTTR